MSFGTRLPSSSAAPRFRRCFAHSMRSARASSRSISSRPVPPERVPARVVSLRAVEPAATPAVPSTRAQDIAAANQALAAKYFLEGAELDDGENRDLAAAAGAYRRAALFDPHLVPAVVNLANIYYERDELVEAEALYEKGDPAGSGVLRGLLQPRQHPPRSRPVPGGAGGVPGRARDQSRVSRSAFLPGRDAREARPFH